MDLSSILVKAGGIDAIANQLGIPPQTAQAGAEALLPAILGGFKNSAQSNSGGLGGLVDILGGMGGGGLFDNVVGTQPTNVDQGNDILGTIFGSKDVSRSVAGQASEQTGIDSGTLKKMLPILAMLVAGYMAQQGGKSGSDSQDGGILGNILGGLAGGGQAQSSGGSLGGLGSLLDMDGDGNPLDDIIGMAGKAFK